MLKDQKRQQPELEKIQKPVGESLVVRQFSETHRNSRPFWHYHPEMELVYVRGGSGKRHIGSHLSYFHDGELVLIGPNLPHQGFTNRLTNFRTETVIQVPVDFLGQDFLAIPEMGAVRQLLERSKLGLSFFGESKERIGNKVERMARLKPFERIVTLLDILQDMATTEEYLKLNATGFSLEVSKKDYDRLNMALNHIRKHFQRSISIPEMADLMSMTEPSFCRYFKKLTGKTFTRFVNEYRLVHAIKLLTEEDISIAQICEECGYSNYSHFTKHFKEFTGRTPTQYRNEIGAEVS